MPYCPTCSPPPLFPTFLSLLYSIFSFAPPPLMFPSFLSFHRGHPLLLLLTLSSSFISNMKFYRFQHILWDSHKFHFFLSISSYFSQILFCFTTILFCDCPDFWHVDIALGVMNLDWISTICVTICYNKLAVCLYLDAIGLVNITAVPSWSWLFWTSSNQNPLPSISLILSCLSRKLKFSVQCTEVVYLQPQEASHGGSEQSRIGT